LLDAQVEQHELVLEVVTASEDELVLAQLLPLLRRPVVLDEHLVVRNLHIHNECSRDVVVLIPLAEDFDALNVKVLPHAKIHLPHSVVRAVPRVAVGGRVPQELLVTAQLIE